MKLRVKVHEYVEIDVDRLIKALIDKELNPYWEPYTAEALGEYFIVYPVLEKEEKEIEQISKEQYDYIKALQTIQTYLKNNKTE